MDAGTLLRRLLATDRSDDVAALIAEFEELNSQRVAWAPVGGRSNNSGTIQAASDPARSLVERITNAVDAVIERAHLEHQGKPECHSPNEAVQAWFAIPAKGLHDLSATKRRQIAEAAVTVTLLEGTGRAKRCVEVADKGIGLTAEEMPGTILSLNEENKLGKFYLSGAFGQGGSATFATADFTLIASQKTMKDEPIAFTVVRYEPPKGVKLGSYVYLTLDGAPLSAHMPEAPLQGFSTVVRHYGYDLDDYPSPLGVNSIYGRSQTILFEPVLPFILDSRIHGYRRTMKGSRTALNGAVDEEDPEDSKLSHSMPLYFSDLGEFGQIGIEYWVLDQGSGKSPPNAVFVDTRRPILLSVNGQTHAEWSSSLLKKDAGLLHIASRMVVHLDANRLSLEAKRILFVSNREESRRGIVQNLIIQELLEALKSDERLDVLNEEARNAGLKERDEEAERQIRTEVSKMLKLFGYSVAEPVGSVGKPTKNPSDDPSSGTGSGRRQPAPIALQEPPTFVELVGNAPVEFWPGKRRYLRVRTDAHSKHHSASDPGKSDFRFFIGGQGLKITGTTPLENGHMRLIVAAQPEAEAGAIGQIVVELRPASSTTLSSSLDYAVVQAPPPRERPNILHLPEIDIQPVESQDDPQWVQYGWPDEHSEFAADYWPQENRVSIRYSTLFPRFRDAHERLGRKGAALAASFQRRFEIWLTTSVLIHWQDVKADPTPLQESELDDEQISNFRWDELRRMAKAAIVYAQREVEAQSSALANTAE